MGKFIIFMKIVLKKSKIKRLKEILNNNKFFIVCNKSSMKTENFVRLSQSLLNMNLYCHTINNQLLKNIYKRSIFINYVNSISGSIVLVLEKKDKNVRGSFISIVKELNKYNIDVIAIYYNYQIYSTQQLIRLQFLNYEGNLLLFYQTLRNLLTIPVCKFIEKNKFFCE